MKYIKKISYVILFILLLGIQLVVPDDVPATESKTLRQLHEELNEWERKYKENKHEQEVTQGQIDSAKSQITKIGKEQEQIENDIEDLTAEIKELEKQIQKKNLEIKDIIAYYQLTATGSDASLEYIFTATDFTDFIYRMAITEQLSDYNDSLIADYENLISTNEKTKDKLSKKTIELEDKKKELESKLTTLRTELKTTMSGAVSIEEEIAAQKKIINVYENIYKCKMDETIDECLRGRLPAGTAFYRPIKSGRVTSNWGSRTYKLNGKWKSDFHYAVDFSGPYKTPVYSAANGQVAAIFKKSSCGGNMVYINHIINGKKYTTGYYHLASISVKVGDNVTYETEIGKQGGSSKEYWDSCSTGTHVHFTVSTGNWGTTFSSYSGFISHNINPRKVVNIPAVGTSFTSRWTKY